jgi:hypothetical protein
MQFNTSFSKAAGLGGTLYNPAEEVQLVAYVIMNEYVILGYLTYTTVIVVTGPDHDTNHRRSAFLVQPFASLAWEGVGCWF